MRDYYGSVGFSCVLMGLIAFLVLASSPEARATPEISDSAEQGPASERVEAVLKSTASIVEQKRETDLPSQTSGWGQEARLVAGRVLAKYGQPDEASAEALVWRRRDPWKRIVVRRDGVSRSFPNQHTDYLEQTISYRLAPEKFSDLAQFDGGLLADRARGELTARSDREETNYLTLNLADEIARGKRKPSQARSFAAKSLAMTASGRTTAYTSGLLFPLTRTGAADPDTWTAPAPDDEKEQKK